MLGCDAHEPWRVADKEEIRIATEFAKNAGIRLTDDVKIIDPFAIDG